jgi:hypothetical protein
MRRFLFALALFLLAMTPSRAQITVPNTFTNGTVADANQVNANFTTLGNLSLNRSGGSMTGNLIFTDALYDIGASGATRPRDLFLSRNLTFGGLLIGTGGPGTNNLTASGTGVQELRIRNSAAGGTNQSLLNLGNDVSTGVISLAGFSSTFASAAYNQASGGVLQVTGSGGLSIVTTTSAPIRLYANTAEVERLTSAGIAVGSTNLTDSIGTPTTPSVCGTNVPTITGKDFAFILTLVGTPGTLSACPVTFGGTYINAPVCVASDASAATPKAYIVATTTTGLTLTGNTGSGTNDKIAVLCRGI